MGPRQPVYRSDDRREHRREKRQQRIHVLAHQEMGDHPIGETDEQCASHGHQWQATVPIRRPAERLAQPLVADEGLAEFREREDVLMKQPMSQDVLADTDVTSEVSVAAEQLPAEPEGHSDREGEEDEVGNGWRRNSQAPHRVPVAIAVRRLEIAFLS